MNSGRPGSTGLLSFFLKKACFSALRGSSPANYLQERTTNQDHCLLKTTERARRRPLYSCPLLKWTQPTSSSRTPAPRAFWWRCLWTLCLRDRRSCSSRDFDCCLLPSEPVPSPSTPTDPVPARSLIQVPPPFLLPPLPRRAVPPPHHRRHSPHPRRHRYLPSFPKARMVLRERNLPRRALLERSLEGCRLMGGQESPLLLEGRS